MAAKKKAAEKKEKVEPTEESVEATEKTVEVTVTQEMLDAMPQLGANDIHVGDLVSMSEAEAAPFMKEKEEKTEKPVSTKGATAVLKGNEYIRTYGADQKDELAEFLSKNPSYTSVPDASIAELEVRYDVKKTDGTIDHTSKRFSDKAEAILFRNEHRSTATVVPSK